MRNAAYSSGGFYLGDGAEMEMNGGMIRKNQGTTHDYPATPTGFWSDSPGGGIFVSDWAVDGIGLDKKIAKIPIDTWSEYYAGKLLI